MSPAYANPNEVAVAARAALAGGTEATVIVDVADAARRFGRDAATWQWAGLLHRSLHDHREALAAFEQAQSIAPQDALIALGLAQVRLEAGLDARPHFFRAIQLKPSSDALLGLMAARYAQGEGAAALEDLGGILASNAGWIEGHRQWAQLAAMVGQPMRATETIDEAISGQRNSASLWQAKVDILERAERHVERWQACDEAIVETGQRSAFALARAAALSDAGEEALAGDAFAKLGAPIDIGHAIHLARHYIRTGERHQLGRLAGEWMTGPGSRLFWPYASIAWRWSEPARWQWLEGDERLVREIDLPIGVDAMERLADRLRQLHGNSGRFLDQSVRGGTQTDGPLLSRIDPELAELRQLIVAAVGDYVGQLPPFDATHPMLSLPRDRPVRFAGSWSVRLVDKGFHTAHVHPQGWISSAFYVRVPEAEGRQGWLTLGAPPDDLRTDLAPLREVAPQSGKLVLFPSMMWHGTRPFDIGERMTVAFDVAPPRT